MTDQDFNLLVDAATTRMKTLYERAGSPKTHQHGIVPETFEELQIALEELDVAGEELRQQNEALLETQRRLAEERFRYQELFNAAPDAYFVTDSSGIVMEANLAASRLINVGDRYLRGKPLPSYVAEPDRAQFRSHITLMQQTSETMRWQLDLHPRHRDPIPVEVSAIRMPSAGGDSAGILWLIRDISKQRRAEQAHLLLDREQFARSETERAHSNLAQIIEESAVPFFFVDENWRLTIVNQRCLEAWGKPRGEVIWRNLWEICPILDKSTIGRAIRQAAADRSPAFFEAVSPILNHWVTVHLSPTLGGVAVYFRDIHAEKEQRLRIEEGYEQDRRIAETLQQSLLTMPPSDHYELLDIGMVYEPAWQEAQVGGDYYDIFRIGNGNRKALVVGDVAGKGLAAAAFTAQIKYALRAFLWETATAGEALCLVNNYICELHQYTPEPDTRLVAITVAVIDFGARTLTTANAGGVPCLILRADGTVEISPARGLLVGVDPGQKFEEHSCPLHAGDALLLTTDGIVEARSPDGCFFNMEDLTALLADADFSGDLQDAANRILAHVKSFAGNQIDDDVCLLLAREKGALSSSKKRGG